MIFKRDESQERWQKMTKLNKSKTFAAMAALYGSSSPIIAPNKPVKKRKPRTYPEHAEQCLVVAWCRSRRLLVHSIPNGGKRSKWAGERERAAGLTAGVSDLFLAEPSGLSHGAYIEMKSKGKKPTEVQRGWLETVKGKGYASGWFDSHVSAISFIRAYMGI